MAVDARIARCKPEFHRSPWRDNPLLSLSCPLRVPWLFSLHCRITCLPIEVVQVLDFDKIKTSLVYALQQFDNLLVTNRCASLRSHETAAPVIRTKRLRQALRPYLRPAIRDRGQLQAIPAH